jgi:hypothetical protein
MNERIRELAEQAGLVRGGYANTPDKIMTWRESFDSPGSLEKFAELIIRECVKSTLSLRNPAIDNEWNLDETFHMIVDTIVEDLDMQHIFRGEE